MRDKEMELALRIVSFAPVYLEMTERQKKKLEELLSKANRDILGLVLDNIPTDSYEEFFTMITDLYIDSLARNGKQRKFLEECIHYKRDNLKRQNRGEEITRDTYNFGKHCDKFSKRKSHQKKAKGKSFARVRASEVGFY